jgi:hypothetical protein
MNQFVPEAKFDTERAAKIAALNDKFRAEIGADKRTVPGMYLTTRGVAMFGMLNDTALDVIAEAVKTFTDFEDGDDPYQERDFFAFDYCGQKLFAKIDYYADSTGTWGADHPEDPTKSYRVLTVMRASEY